MTHVLDCFEDRGQYPMDFARTRIMKHRSSYSEHICCLLRYDNSKE